MGVFKSSIVVCINPHGSHIFMIVRTLILLSLAARLTTVSLDLCRCAWFLQAHEHLLLKVL